MASSACFPVIDLFDLLAFDLVFVGFAFVVNLFV